MPAPTRKPVPVRIGVANAASVSVPDERSENIFERLFRDSPGVEVWLVVECADFSAHELLSGVSRTAAIQRGTKGSPLSALVIAWRTETGFVIEDSYVRMGSQATAEGGGIRDRWILGATLRVRNTPRRRGWSRKIEVGHAPPPRAPRARKVFLDNFRIGRGIKGGDTNVKATGMRHLFPHRDMVSHGVMHLVVPRSLRITGVELIDHGSDHKAVAATVRPKWWAW